MINNLFSIFDPTTSSWFSSNWISMIFVFIFLPLNYWFIPSRFNWLLNNILGNFIKETKNNLKKKNLKIIYFLVTLFWIIFLWNFLGLLPYIFTCTSHLNVTLALSLPLWVLITLFGWVNVINKIFTHLVPLGSPIYLSFFIVIIETISFLIRPITLCIRLCANIIAGHLLICLLSQIRENIPEIFSISRIPLTILLYLELAVSLIQSYVFVTLFSLYLREIN